MKDYKMVCDFLFFEPRLNDVPILQKLLEWKAMRGFRVDLHSAIFCKSFSGSAFMSLFSERKYFSDVTEKKHHTAQKIYNKTVDSGH